MFTSEQIEEYKNNPEVCPHCQNDDLTTGSTEHSTSSSWRRVQCNSCTEEWCEVFTLIAIE